MSTTSPSALLGVVALCHFGHHNHVPGADPTRGDFLEASLRGLIVGHPHWRVTERGIHMLIGAKLLPGEPIKPRTVVHALWCVDQYGQPGFVIAFPDDFVKDSPAHYAQASLNAKQRYLAGLDLPDRSAASFFTTVTALEIPPAPDSLGVHPTVATAPPAPLPPPSPLDTELAGSLPA